MDPVVNSVPPHIPPAVAFEKIFKHGSGVQGAGQPDSALVDNERPTGVIGNKAIIFEFVSAWLAPKEKGFEIVRVPPAGGFPDDMLGVFQQAHLSRSLAVKWGQATNVSPHRSVPDRARKHVPTPTRN